MKGKRQIGRPARADRVGEGEFNIRLSNRRLKGNRRPAVEDDMGQDRLEKGFFDFVHVSGF